MESQTITFLQGDIPAGFPSPAMDYVEKRIDLNEYLVKNPLSTFVIDCAGLSMINAFIAPKSKLVVDKSIAPKNGDIVLAVINGEFTIKYLKKNENKCWLVAANSKFKPLEITPEMSFQVWGVVTKIINDPNENRCLL
jgi:DNA polymerase V